MQAWCEMTREEDDPIWDRFDEQLGFRPSVHAENFPGIREPTPSLTYDISDAFSGDRAHCRQYEIDLNLKTLQAWRLCIPAPRRICALDWQHTCYWLAPHEPFESRIPEAWAVPTLPDGDYSIFLSEDLELGMFGHPWEQTLCVWGQPLLDAFERDLPSLLTRLVRRNGAAV